MIVKRLVQDPEWPCTPCGDSRLLLSSTRHLRVAKNYTSEHKVLGNILQSNDSQDTSSRVFFIGVSSDTSMKRRLYGIEISLSSLL